MSTRQVDDVDARRPVGWCTYRGDQRRILDPEANPLNVAGALTWPIGAGGCLGRTQFPASVFGALGTVRGPNTMNEKLWPVVAEYDPEADTTRVGWSYIMPPEDTP